MPDLNVLVAIIGRRELMLPGIIPIKFEDPDFTCHVQHSLIHKLASPPHDIKEIDVSDCTLFLVTHLAHAEVDLTTPVAMQGVFERSIAAISEVIVWSKARDRAQKSDFATQIGYVNAKAFFVPLQDGRLVAWLNPLYEIDRALDLSR